jgi:hypothetical protein
VQEGKNMNNSKDFSDTKKVFMSCGTCSRTFFFILNREFGHLKENEERASDLLAGGLMQTGHQCGMLWGASLAVGAECFRRYQNKDQAIAAAILTSQHLMKSFSVTEGKVNCRELTGYDMTSIFDMIKFIFNVFKTGIMNSFCFNLAERWVPEAIKAAHVGLSFAPASSNRVQVNCACETAKRMGATDEEMVMVAGFAGGLGLSGYACGALAAAIWMKLLGWCKNHPHKTPPYFNNTHAKKILKTFYCSTNSEILCSRIALQQFKTADDHSEFIKNGGCKSLISALSQ